MKRTSPHVGYYVVGAIAILAALEILRYLLLHWLQTGK